MVDNKSEARVSKKGDIYLKSCKGFGLGKNAREIFKSTTPAPSPPQVYVYICELESASLCGQDGVKLPNTEQAPPARATQCVGSVVAERYRGPG